jgi:hypothetical protein
LARQNFTLQASRITVLKKPKLINQNKNSLLI